ncbi:MAG: GNAT family N-acetyltransferase [Bernardetiaceae bacterium]|jgi:aminoglycoside 3-N-acetyltransferase I|nr:GNAT family N-acetyltransferase [Bernardetiaceae bacterium]
MEIKKLNYDEISHFKDLIEIFKSVFENEEQISDDEQLGKLLSDPSFVVFVARLDSKVIGGLTMYILHRYYGTKPVAYIYDVGISPDFQGQGIGKSLIAEVCKYCKNNGFADAYVEAETDDIDAVNFYRKTKFSTEMNAIHFTYTFGGEN